MSLQLVARVLVVGGNSYSLVTELCELGYAIEFEDLMAPSQMIEAQKRGAWDALICDCEHVGSDGTTIIRAISRNELNTPVIFVANTFDLNRARSAIKEGAYDWVEIGNPERLLIVLERARREGAESRDRTHSAVDALRHAEEHYESLIELSSEATFIRIENRFAFLNRAAVDLFGASDSSELIGRAVLDFVHPEFKQTIQNRMDVTEAENTSLPYLRQKIVRLDGIVKEVEAAAFPIVYRQKKAIQVVVRDLRQQLLLAEVAEVLGRSEEQFFKVFRSSPCAISLSRFEDGKLIEVNDRYVELVGGKREEMVGRTSIELGLWANPHDRTKIASQLRAQGRIHNLEIEVRRQSGEQGWALASFELMELPNELVVITMAVDITGRKRAEEKARESEASLHALADRLLRTREEEASRIARELHDELSQTLTGLKLDAGRMARQLGGAIGPADVETLQQRAARMIGAIDEIIPKVRKLCVDLRPAILDEMGLGAAVEWQAQEFQDRTGIRCAAQVSVGPAVIGADASTGLFRILQEALTNVARHANASTVSVELRLAGEMLELIVADNGRGISPGESAKLDGLGLLGMRERIAAVGGQITVRSAPGQGTTLVARAPAERGN